MLEDYRTAPINERLRAALAFLEKMTLTPNELTAADAQHVVDTGVTRAALRDAVLVCSLFNMIDRIADTLNFAVPPDEAFRVGAKFLLSRGYKH